MELQSTQGALHIPQAFEEYLDYLITSLLDESMQDPFLVQLRSAVETAMTNMIEQNIDTIGIPTNQLLSNITHLVKPITFFHIVNRMGFHKRISVDPDAMALIVYKL